MEIALIVTRLLLATVFAVSGVAKLADRPGSRQATIDFGVPPSLAGSFGILLPLAELTVAVALLPASTAWWGAFGSLTLLLVFVAGIAGNLARGRKPNCRCFGQFRSGPVGWSTVTRNAVLAALAAFVVWQGYGGAGPSALGWVGDVLAAGPLTLLVLVILTLSGAQWWFLMHLFRQNGRLLVRLRAVEARLGINGEAAPSENGSQRVAGLPVGSAAPSFTLSNLRGELVTLEDLLERSKPVVLIFTSPECAYCIELLPQISRWQEEHAEKLEVALVSHLSADENRVKTAEHGVENVLLQEDWEVADTYGAEAAPSAVLVSPDGAIGSPLLEGPNAIEELVAYAVGDRAQPPMPHTPHNHVARDDLPRERRIGEDAPRLDLPDLEGKSVSLLEDFRGEETMVLFWSPGCGFCQEMLPDLKEWEADPPEGAPALLVVSEGAVEENRAMGFSSPVILDDTFDASDAFGVTGTPSAVLVDAQGRIASEVAEGATAVFSLARDGRPRTPSG